MEFGIQGMLLSNSLIHVINILLIVDVVIPIVHLFRELQKLTNFLELLFVKLVNYFEDSFLVNVSGRFKFNLATNLRHRFPVLDSHSAL